MRRPVGQPFLIVLEQEPPCPGIALDDVEDGLALAGHQGMARERSREEPDRLFDLAQASLRQPSVVQGVPAQEVVAQGAGGPDAKLSATRRLHPIPDRDDDVQVVVVDLARDRPAPLGLNLCKFCTGFRGVDLTRNSRAAPSKGPNACVRC